MRKIISKDIFESLKVKVKNMRKKVETAADWEECLEVNPLLVVREVFFSYISYIINSVCNKMLSMTCFLPVIHVKTSDICNKY